MKNIKFCLLFVTAVFLAFASSIYGATISTTPSKAITKPTLSVQPTTQVKVPPQEVVTPPKEWLQVSVGSDATYAIAGDHSLWWWDTLTHYNEHEGFLPDDITYYPKRLGSDYDWVSVSSGAHYACGLKFDGSLWCWGSNLHGQLGNGEGGMYEEERESVQVAGSETDWSEVSAGLVVTCATKTNGTLWCWGLNQDGALGLGIEGTPGIPNIEKHIPTRVGTDATWKLVSTKDFHVCAIKSEKIYNSLWCWGDNYYGQIGDGTKIDRRLPTQIFPRANFRQVSTAESKTCAIMEDGTLWCWGAAPLGDGTMISRTFPTQVNADKDWVYVDSGVEISCAIKSNGTLWCWGNIECDTSDTHRYCFGFGSLLPEKVGTDTNWTEVSITANRKLCAMKTDGSVWCFGIFYASRPEVYGVGAGLATTPVRMTRHYKSTLLK